MTQPRVDWESLTLGRQHYQRRAAGMLSTIDMVSRRGRASRLGERSRGVQDAGATSIYHVLHAFGTGFTE